MISAIDHIGIAVADLETGKALYSKIFQVQSFHEETVEEFGVAIASFLLNGVRIELTAPLHEDTPIGKFLAKRGEGIHHIAFRSSDINGDLDSLKKQDIQLIHEAPHNGAHDMLIAFLHPSSTGGVLMELCSPKQQS
jgi:methylmalonyl-CoA/ethylmalonyl-CoA epimerase